MRRLLGVSCVVAALTGCGRGEYAMQVQVIAPATSTSVCTKVTATKGSTTLASEAASISPGSTVEVIIALDNEDTVAVFAEGFDNADCAGAPVEQSPTRTAAPARNAPFPVVALILNPTGVRTDGGTDAGVDDAGFDAGIDDAGFDAGIDDAGFDAGLDDAGVDAGIDDAGFDAGIDDAGFDAGLDDAGFDAGLDDAGVDAGLDDAGVDAGATSCASGIAGEACANGGGVCNDQGACISNFPYTPSNVALSALAGTDGGLALSLTGGVGAINTTDGGFSFITAVPFRFVASDGGTGRVMVLHLDSMNVSGGATLDIIGDNPLIIAVSGDATIAGTVLTRDMADSVDCIAAGTGGATAGNMSCDDGVGGNETCGGGGGGAGYGRSGGVGGTGGTSPSAAGGTAGGVSGGPALTPLRGGCTGGSGGLTGGVGGRGGGGLQLSVANTLTVTGTIAAPGRGGGAGGTSRRGGGGGGSGGAVLLEASLLQLSGKVTANGGAGGSGATAGTNGSVGADAHLDDALGANGGTSNARGGDGGTGLIDATDGANSTAGGGGGAGAGVGRIRFNVIDACINPGALVSPAASTNGGTFTVDAGC